MHTELAAERAAKAAKREQQQQQHAGPELHNTAREKEAQGRMLKAAAAKEGRSSLTLRELLRADSEARLGTAENPRPPGLDVAHVQQHGVGDPSVLPVALESDGDMRRRR